MNPHKTVSVVAVPVALVVTTVAQAPDEIALVPRADVPLAIVRATVLSCVIVITPLTFVANRKPVEAVEGTT